MVGCRLGLLLFFGLLVAQSVVSQQHAIKDNPMEKLYEASQAGDKQGIWLALDNGADINKGDLGGVTALMHAAAKGQAAATEELIEQGANVNIQNVDGATALMIAIERGARETVKILLRHDADVNIVDANGATALMRAAFVVYEDGVDTLKSVLDAGGAKHLDKYAHEGDTPLLAAAWNQNWAAMAVLVDLGADVNLPDKKKGLTALMAASAHPHAPTVRLLLEHGADVSAVANGKTALDFLKVSRNQAEAVAEARGTDFDATDFDAARQSLLAHGAKTNNQSIYDRYLLYGFCGAMMLAGAVGFLYMLCRRTPPASTPSEPTVNDDARSLSPDTKRKPSTHAVTAPKTDADIDTNETKSSTNKVTDPKTNADTSANAPIKTDVQKDSVLRRRNVQK